MKRISKIAIELNVPVNIIIQELKKSSDKKFELNSKLNPDEVRFLTNIFQKDRDTKIEVEKRKAVYHFDIDENFEFKVKEKNILLELYTEYKKNKDDITQLKQKSNRFSDLETEEIDVLLKSKFQRIFEIQKEVKEDRILRIDVSSNQSDYDPHENFQWGGLSGEEAHTAYWNCD